MLPRLPAYTKSHLTFPQQLALLKSRGMQIDDDAAGVECLHRIGYYRLSAYWYPLRRPRPGSNPPSRLDDFLPGTTFQMALDLYMFDKRLRFLLLDALERIEIAVRVDIAYHLGQINPFAHTDPSLLDGLFVRPGRIIPPQTTPSPSKHQNWINKYETAIRRSSEEFIKHFNRTYAPPLPIWTAVEVWDFGQTSWFYSGMKVIDRNVISSRYGIYDWRIMESWLRTLNVARNIVAHHGRLWNRNMGVRPQLPPVGNMPEFDHLVGDITGLSRVYVVCCILAHFVDQIHPRSSWKQRLIDHLDVFPVSTGLGVADMGFPNSWKSHNIWT
jgi:abortive infection bacteriophage resistance protein